MKNRYGLDVSYFKKELTTLLDSLDNRTPPELYRYFQRLADVVHSHPDFGAPYTDKINKKKQPKIELEIPMGEEQYFHW
jgi:hypothetical protein